MTKDFSNLPEAGLRSDVITGEKKNKTVILFLFLFLAFKKILKIILLFFAFLSTISVHQ